jgi:hypothetical protein
LIGRLKAATVDSFSLKIKDRESREKHKEKVVKKKLEQTH